MTPSALSSLIARVESDEAWSRELADAVLIAAGWVRDDYATVDGWGDEFTRRIWRSPEGGEIGLHQAPDPLRSLDFTPPGENITGTVWGPAGWEAAHTQPNCLTLIGRCPIPGREGEARARRAAWLRSVRTAHD